MAVNSFKTFAAGEVLTASDLNSSFSQITNNGEDLGWPATKAKDLNGSSLILDSDADTHITSDTDDQIDFSLGGTDLFVLKTVASAVNGLTITASAAADPILLTAFGTDSNIDILLVPKGTGGVDFNGATLILDADGDTTIDAGTDDTIDIKVAGTVVHQITANGLQQAKNLIIGGDFSLNPWQRGTSFAAIADATFSADRFAYNKEGTMVHTIAKTADAPTVAEAGIFTEHCLLVDCTTLDSSLAAGDFVHIQQTLEGFTWAKIARREFTICFWHKHTKTGIYCVGLRNNTVGTPDRSFVGEYTQTTTDTWERGTVVVSASPSAGTWDFREKQGVEISFALASGTTFHTTAGAWNTGNFIATSNQVNACDSTANNFKLALIQVNEGGVALDFQMRTYAEELELCQRYFFKTFPRDVDPGQNVGVPGAAAIRATTNGAFTFSIDYPVIMRANPTIVTFNPSAANAEARNETDSTDTPAGASAFDDRVTTIDETSLDATDANDKMLIHITAESELN